MRIDSEYMQDSATTTNSTSTPYTMCSVERRVAFEASTRSTKTGLYKWMNYITPFLPIVL